MRQYIVIRNDLKLGKGKIAAQVAHASVSCVLQTPSTILKKWVSEGQPKIVLKVSSENELNKLYELATKNDITCVLIHDAGKTQIEAGTTTALGLGPADDKVLETITKNLSLL